MNSCFLNPLTRLANWTAVSGSTAAPVPNAYFFNFISACCKVCCNTNCTGSPPFAGSVATGPCTDINGWEGGAGGAADSAGGREEAGSLASEVSESAEVKVARGRSVSERGGRSKNLIQG